MISLDFFSDISSVRKYREIVYTVIFLVGSSEIIGIHVRIYSDISRIMGVKSYEFTKEIKGFLE